MRTAGPVGAGVLGGLGQLSGAARATAGELTPRIESFRRSLGERAEKATREALPSGLPILQLLQGLGERQLPSMFDKEFMDIIQKSARGEELTPEEFSFYQQALTNSVGMMGLAAPVAAPGAGALGTAAPQFRQVSPSRLRRVPQQIGGITKRAAAQGIKFPQQGAKAVENIRNIFSSLKLP